MGCGADVAVMVIVETAAAARVVVLRRRRAGRVVGRCIVAVC